MRALLLALTLTAIPALADERAAAPMTPGEFEAYTTGRTLTYAQDGEVYGTEEYLPGRRVRWAFAEGECEIGRWYEQDGWICFAYESTPEPQCWQFFRGDAGISAQFMGDATGSPLSELAQSDAPLNCPGPDVGV
jgi:hypothetical protein